MVPVWLRFTDLYREYAVRFAWTTWTGLSLPEDGDSGGGLLQFEIVSGQTDSFERLTAGSFTVLARWRPLGVARSVVRESEVDWLKRHVVVP